MRMNKDYGRIIAYYFSEPPQDSTTFVYGESLDWRTDLKNKRTGITCSIISPYNLREERWKKDTTFLSALYQFFRTPITGFEIIDCYPYSKDFSEDSDTMGPALDPTTFTYGTDHSVVVVLEDPETGEEYTCMSPYEPGSDGWGQDIDFLSDWNRFTGKPIGKFNIISVKHYPQDFAELAGKTVEGILTKEELQRKSKDLGNKVEYDLNQDLIDSLMKPSRERSPSYQLGEQQKKYKDRQRYNADPYVTYFYKKDSSGPKDVIKVTHTDPKLAMDSQKTKFIAEGLGLDNDRNLSSITGNNPDRK